MAFQIKFNTAGQPEQPTIVLAKKNGEHIGILTGVSEFKVKDYLNAATELSMTVNKTINGKETNYWDDVSNLRLIYIPEWDKHFEIYVEVDENNTCIKNITARSLCESELSQLLLNMEVNTEDDIARDDYVKTVLYNQDNVKGSLLHRMLADKAQHYKIIHVDESIQNIQRTFTFSDKSIYDAFQEISEEIHCLFVFGKTDERWNSFRTISVYDLESNCSQCKHRGEYTDTCPECGSKDIIEGYGEDTTIFLSKENLAEGIIYSTDIDSVKNCFRLEAGDNFMTASAINVNPAGSAYLWYFPDSMKKDMSTELVEKLEQYDKEYYKYQNTHVFNLDSLIVNKYNQLVTKYKTFNESLELVQSSIKGYRDLTKIYYDTIDFEGYLQTSLLPKIEMTGTSAAQQASLLIASNLSPVSAENISYISLATANSIILGYAKVYIDTSRYRVKVKESTLDSTTKIWSGIFTVTSYTDEEDTAESKRISIQINDDYESFVRQKIEKTLAKDKNDDISIVSIFKKSDTEFKAELKKYSLSHLNIFYDACQSCLNILIEQGVADNNPWQSSSDAPGNLYDSLYTPYYNKSVYVMEEMKLREEEIGIIVGSYDETGYLLSHGLQSLVSNERDTVTGILNFKKYIGDYWNELCTFRREDVWKNDNYISDGLTNSEIFELANEFIQSATKDLIKSATLQHSISATLKNLLIVAPFKSLRKHFSVGNWLRISIDDKLYKLRLISYEIDYDDMDNISVEFSDVVDHLGALSDIESILNQSKSISTSYSSTKHQASKGAQGKDTLDGWVQKGLNATLTKIVNSADNQDIVYDKHGLLVRKYDEETNSYSPLQLKIINGTLAVTDDDWETAKTGVGKFIYLDPKDRIYKTGYGIIANQLVGNIVLSEEVGVYSKNGSMTFNEDGLNIKGLKNTFTVNPNAETLLALRNEKESIFYVDKNGQLHIKGDGSALDITANDVTKNLTSKIEQTANEITLEVSRAKKSEEELSTSISIMADQITTKVTAKEAESIIEQKADSIRLKADKIAWSSQYSSMSENGVLKCISAELKGSLRCGSDYGLWAELSSNGKLTGGNGSQQNGYIDYSATAYNESTGERHKGIQIQGGSLRISVDSLSTRRSQNVNDETYLGCSGTMTYISNIEDTADGFRYTTSSIRFENGLMVTRL